MKKIKNLLPLFLGLLFLLFTGGRFNNPLLAWLPNIFIIRYYRSGNHILRYFTTVLSVAAISIITWYGIQPLPLPAYIISMTVTSFITAVPYVLDRLLYKKVARFASTLVFPVSATLLEYIFITGNPMGSFGALAYSQAGNPAVMQLAGVAGIMGITFLMNWFPSYINGLWESYENRTFSKKKVLPLAIVFVFIYLYGFISLSLPATEDEIKASAIFKTEQGYGLQEIMPQVSQGLFTKAEENYQSYLSLSEREITDGQELIAWPEGAVITSVENLPSKLDEISQLAARGHVIIAAPFVILEEGKPFDNSLYLFGPEGEVLFKHVKFGGNEFEGSLKGSGKLQGAEIDDSNYSGVICWDMDFPMPMSQLGQLETDILFAPASDWKEITPMHGHMALFRAIEHGTSLIRPTASGLTLISDEKGRILSSADWFDTEENVIRASVPTKGRSTLYSKTGDILPLILAAGAMIQLLVLLVNGLRKVLQRRLSADTPLSGRDSYK